MHGYALGFAIAGGVALAAIFGMALMRAAARGDRQLREANERRNRPRND